MNDPFTKIDIAINGMNVPVYLSETPPPFKTNSYLQTIQQYGVTDIFCFCKPEYDVNIFNDNNVRHHDFEYPDGDNPDDELLDRFDRTIKRILLQNISSKCVFNFHCRAGLGRAPTMLAYLMITHTKIERFECVDHIRNNRKGCFNRKQLEWIFNFKKKNKSCILM